MDAYQFSLAQDFNLVLGIILGLVISGILKTVLNFLADRFERPQIIKFGNLNGKLEKGTDFENLYFFSGYYYTQDQHEFLVKERMKDIRSHARISPVVFFPLTLFLFSMIIFAFLIFNSKIGF